MEVVQRLKAVYGVNTPIFLDEIKTAVKGYSVPYIFQSIREAVEKGELIRYDDSIYYIPTETIFGKSAINSYDVIEKKYIKDKGKTFGFYSGWIFLNAIGGTAQVPNILEVVTNKETMRVREARLGGKEIILRKPKCTVNSENQKPLQMLEVANKFEIDKYIKRALLNYAKANKITAKDLLKYVEFYPAKVAKNMSGVLYELA
ncbi:MAG: hypothetical protein LBT20_04505 [Clostridiales bacterium]|nr:hypothetical protein [Clostridiales bacterium]